MNILTDQKTVFSYRKNEIYSGKAVFPDGREFDWTTAKFQDSVSIFPRHKSGKIIIVKQWRPAINDWSYEQPAGGVEEGMSLRDNAMRELIEETGYKAFELSYWRDFYFSCGLMNFKISFFTAFCRDEDFVGHNRDESELMETLLLSPMEILDLIADGKHVDPELITSIFLFSQFEDRIK